MKKIILSLMLIAILGVSASYAESINYTFEKARITANNNSKALKLQDEIIESLTNKKNIQSSDYAQNRPDYEYSGITKTEVYNNTYKTYDYAKILKNEIQNKKNMIISNETKTLTLFSNIVNLRNEIKNKQMEIADKTAEFNASYVKLNNGMITRASHNSVAIALENLNTELKNLETKLELEEKRFKEHLGIDVSTSITLELIEPDLDMLIPDDALSETEKNKKEFLDLKEDLKELNSDMEWIHIANYGAGYRKTVKEQEKLIEEKEKDIEELRKNTLYNYNTVYDKILIKANEISLDKINKIQLELKKSQVEASYKQGYSTKSAVNEIETQIDANILSQLKKQLEIKALISNYQNSMI